jgi:hypothetical protein
MQPIFSSLMPRQIPATAYRLSLDRVFEVVVDEKIHRIERRALQHGILKEREERKGPRGIVLSRRSTLDDFCQNQRRCIAAARMPRAVSPAEPVGMQTRFSVMTASILAIFAVKNRLSWVLFYRGLSIGDL